MSPGFCFQVVRACDDITGKGGFGVFLRISRKCNRFRLYVTRTLASFVVEPSRQRSEMRAIVGFGEILYVGLSLRHSGVLPVGRRCVNLFISVAFFFANRTSPANTFPTGFLVIFVLFRYTIGPIRQRQVCDCHKSSLLSSPKLGLDLSPRHCSMHFSILTL